MAKELAFNANFALSVDEEIEAPEEDKVRVHACPECETGVMEVVETPLPHGPPHIIFRNETTGSDYAA